MCLVVVLMGCKQLFPLHLDSASTQHLLDVTLDHNVSVCGFLFVSCWRKGFEHVCKLSHDSRSGFVSFCE